MSCVFQLLQAALQDPKHKIDCDSCHQAMMPCGNTTPLRQPCYPDPSDDPCRGQLRVGDMQLSGDMSYVRAGDGSHYFFVFFSSLSLVRVLPAAMAVKNSLVQQALCKQALLNMHTCCHAILIRLAKEKLSCLALMIGRSYKSHVGCT